MRPVSWWRLTLLLAPALAALAWVVVRSPLPRRAAGDTRCLPLLGPRVHLDSSGTARELALARAHELEHAAQCERDGFVGNYVKRLSRAGRLAAELDAFCSEARADVTLGTRADHVVARILDELEAGYPWFRGMTRRDFLAAFDAGCADIVTRAQQRAAKPLA
jgi:hypothetical protein